MLSNLNPQKLLYRDGTGQAQRFTDALRPDYAAVDERSTEDLLRFAKELARHFVYFDEDNRPQGNWAGFLEYASGEAGVAKDALVADLVRYAGDPERFSKDPEKLRRLSQPHLVLFIAFLELLEIVKTGLNSFTGRHLDFFYRRVLGLSPQAPLPDRVSVVIRLEEEVDEWFVPKGLALLAGTDSEGKELLYHTERDILVSKAQVAAISARFAVRRTRTLAQLFSERTVDPKAALGRMFELALGHPRPGDPLPPYSARPARLSEILQSLNEGGSGRDLALGYITGELFLSAKDFQFLAAPFEQDATSSATEWALVEEKLTRAYRNKVIHARQQALRQIAADRNEASMAAALREALGEPGPGDPLPLYGNRAVTAGDFTGLLSDLDTEGSKAAAIRYIREELLMSESSFRALAGYIAHTAPAPDAADPFEILELASRKKRGYVLPSPYREEWSGVYAVADSRSSAFSPGGENSAGDLRFSTFGLGYTTPESHGIRPGRAGIAVSSPQLAAAEGVRTFTVRLYLKEDGAIRREQIMAALQPPGMHALPFSFLLSGEKDWIRPVVSAMSLQDRIYPPESAGKACRLLGTAGSNSVWVSGIRLDDTEIGHYIIDGEKRLYVIDFVGPDSATASFLRYTSAGVSAGSARKFSPAELALNVLEIELQLREDDLPVAAPGEDNDYVGLGTGQPVLAMLLDQLPYDREKAPADGYYDLFRGLVLQRLVVDVRVEKLQALLLQNDEADLDEKKPFTPFGAEPHPGSSLYFAHPELSGKRLDSLRLYLHWMNPPKDFGAYYGGYREVQDAGVRVPSQNDDFEAALYLTEGYKNTPLTSSGKLFEAADAQLQRRMDFPEKGTRLLGDQVLSYRPMALPTQPEGVRNWVRYFRLVLGEQDFLHHAYPYLLTKSALKAAVDIRNAAEGMAVMPPVLNLPYTPKLRSLAVGYNASFDSDGLAERNGEDASGAVFHLDTFGFSPVSISDGPYLLPPVTNGGELYLGLSQLAAPQTLSLLFQMAEGSADPDLAPEKIAWSYLRGNEWVPFENRHILSDSTGGLLNSGIIEFAIPADIGGSSLLAPPGLHWLRAAVEGDVRAVPDTVDILAQAVSAVFTGRDNAADHFASPLAPGSVTEPAAALPAVAKIIQPFSSSKGRPAETDRAFYNRVSERLRHKNRALTMWDYERLVLNAFPGIYKVKCIPSPSGGPGSVLLVVIPDVRGSLPFNPFHPKASADTVGQIQQFLHRRIPAYAAVSIKSPFYVQVMVRTTVKIREGYSEDFFKRKLEDELKRYLAPWAYEEGADIVLGGRLHSDMIVNFIAERHYVDYVAGVRLHESSDGEKFREVKADFVETQRPDAVLVSAKEHFIDIVRQNRYREADFTGIGYMRIELDFKVG